MEQKTEEETVENSSWRWVILLSTYALFYAVGFPLTLFTIMYKDIILSSAISTASVTVIFTVNQLFMDSATMFSGPLCSRYGFRVVSFVASLFIAMPLLISGFVRSPNVLFATYAVLSGIGSGILYGSNPVILSKYFDRKLGFSIGLAQSGISIAQITGPYLMDYFSLLYGRYGLMITGAFLLNVCAFSMSLIMPKSVTYARSTIRVTKENKKDEYAFANATFEAGENLPEVKITVTDSFTNDIKQRNYHKKENVCSTIFKEFYNILLAAYRNCRYLRHFRVIVITFSIAILFPALTNFVILIPLALEDSHVGINGSNMVFSALAISNLISRIAVPTLTDILPISKKWFILVGSLLMGVSSIGFTLFMNSLTMMIIFVIFFGISMATATSLQALLIVEFMGKELLPTIISANAIIQVIAFLIVGPLIGLIRDLFKSYVAAMWFISMLAFLSVILWCLMPLAQKMDKERFVSEEPQS